MQNNNVMEIPEIEFEYDDNIKLIIQESNGGEVQIESLDQNVIQDDKYVENLKNCVNKWINLSQILLKYGNEISFTSVIDETKFWCNLVTSL